MKRKFTNIMSFILFSFLLIGIIGIFQNIVQDVQKTFTSHTTQSPHILSYQRV